MQGVESFDGMESLEAASIMTIMSVAKGGSVHHYNGGIRTVPGPENYEKPEGSLNSMRGET